MLSKRQGGGGGAGNAGGLLQSLLGGGGGEHGMLGQLMANRRQQGHRAAFPPLDEPIVRLSDSLQAPSERRRLRGGPSAMKYQQVINVDKNGRCNLLLSE